MTYQVTIVIVAVLALIAFALWLAVKYALSRSEVVIEEPEVTPVDTHLARTLIVHTTDSQTVKGVELPPSAPDSLSLRDAFYVAPGGQETSLSGIVHIPAAKVAFSQEIGLVDNVVKGAQNGSRTPAKALSASEGS